MTPLLGKGTSAFKRAWPVGVIGTISFGYGAFVAGLTTLTGLSDVVVSMVKATLFGYAAGVIACYKGISVGGGPAGVGNAVNETVVFTFMVLFAINVIVTAVGIQFTVS